MRDPTRQAAAPSGLVGLLLGIAFVSGPAVAQVADAAEGVAEVVQSAAPETGEETGEQSAVQSHPLSVEPSTQLLPKDRPAWIGAEPNWESPTHQFVVQSIPTSLESELDSNLDAPLAEAVQDYVGSLLRDDRAGSLIADRLTPSFIRTNLLDDSKSYVAEMNTSAGPMYQKWVMVEVSPKQQEQISIWYSQTIQRQRVLPLAVAVGGLLSLIGASHLVLRRRSRRIAGHQATQVGWKASMEAAAGAPPVRRKSLWSRSFAALVAVGIAIVVIGGIQGVAPSIHRKIKQRKETETFIVELKKNRVEVVIEDAHASSSRCDN